MKHIFIIISIILVIPLFLYLINTGLEKHEEIECKQWKQWDKDYPTHYLLSWQIEQCKKYDIHF